MQNCLQQVAGELNAMQHMPLQVAGTFNACRIVCCKLQERLTYEG